jgi:hypothetical protein
LDSRFQAVRLENIRGKVSMTHKKSRSIA